MVLSIHMMLVYVSFHAAKCKQASTYLIYFYRGASILKEKSYLTKSAFYGLCEELSINEHPPFSFLLLKPKATLGSELICHLNTIFVDEWRMQTFT